MDFALSNKLPFVKFARLSFSFWNSGLLMMEWIFWALHCCSKHANMCVQLVSNSNIQPKAAVACFCSTFNSVCVCVRAVITLFVPFTSTFKNGTLDVCTCIATNFMPCALLHTALYILKEYRVQRIRLQPFPGVSQLIFHMEQVYIAK